MLNTLGVVTDVLGENILFVLTAVNTLFLVTIWLGQYRLAKNQKAINELLEQKKGD